MLDRNHGSGSWTAVEFSGESLASRSTKRDLSAMGERMNDRTLKGREA